jgi:hypothetical protein
VGGSEEEEMADIEEDEATVEIGDVVMIKTEIVTMPGIRANMVTNAGTLAKNDLSDPARLGKVI